METICRIREELAETFHGCFPEYSGYGQIPCCLDHCPYGCTSCPMEEGRNFPRDGSGNTAVDLIRLVKCDGNYIPTDKEIAKAIAIVKG